jgi:signal transduction histidine kinase
MTFPWRPRSLFWPIAGMALVTLILGTLTQFWVVDAILIPLETREARARAEVVVANLANAIATLPDDAPTGAIDSLLAIQRVNLGPRPGWLAYRPFEGPIVTAPQGGGRDSMVAQIFMGNLTPERPPEPGGLPRRRDRFEILARHVVRHGFSDLGELIVTRAVRPRDPFGPMGSRAALFFLPIATVASLGAGLLLVRLLARRLKGIETLAARVADGDLTVRIGDTSGDEIGRIADGLDRMTTRLAESRAELAANEGQRRQLFADITHELATPLTAIRGLAETLLDPKVDMSPEDRTRYVRGVLEESRRLDRLIHDLFELARLEAGATPLVIEPLDLAALASNTVARFTPRFAGAGLALSWHSEVPEAWIEADGLRIEQVLDNLLVNALRYVPSGGHVALALAHGPALNGSSASWRLTLRDDGPGLPASELPYAFERFYRGTAARAAGTPADMRDGSGLGLAIVREILERHHGRVRAEATEPHGLTVVLDLPAADPEAGGRNEDLA